MITQHSSQQIENELETFINEISLLTTVLHGRKISSKNVRKTAALGKLQ